MAKTKENLYINKTMEELESVAQKIQLAMPDLDLTDADDNHIEDDNNLKIVLDHESVLVDEQVNVQDYLSDKRVASPEEIQKYSTKLEEFLKPELKEKQNSQNHNMPITLALAQSENLKVAQERIIDLETELNRLRKENEKLIATGDIFQNQVDQLKIKKDNFESMYQDSRAEFQEEKRTLLSTLKAQITELEKKDITVKELKKRLSINIQHVRVRERELENRLEIINLDKQNLNRDKNQSILDLKRQLDVFQRALDNQKNIQQEKSQKLDSYKEKYRNVTRGLQAVLHVLKGTNILEDYTKKTEEE